MQDKGNWIGKVDFGESLSALFSLLHEHLRGPPAHVADEAVELGERVARERLQRQNQSTRANESAQRRQIAHEVLREQERGDPEVRCVRPPCGGVSEVALVHAKDRLGLDC